MAVMARHRRSVRVAGIATSFVAGLCAACAAACSGGDFALLGTTSGELQPPAPFTAFVADLGAGSLELREGDTPNVVVTGEVLVRDRLDAKTGPAADAAPKLPFADWVALVADGGTVTLRPARRDDDHQLRLRVTLPRGQRDVTARIAAGALDVEVAAATALDLHAAAGNVCCRADAVAGVLRADVGAGQFQGTVQQRCGGVAIEVSVGQAMLALPPDCSGTFALGVGVGGITGADRYGLAVERSLTSASAKGRRGTVEAVFQIHVGTGQIALQ